MSARFWTATTILLLGLTVAGTVLIESLWPRVTATSMRAAGGNEVQNSPHLPAGIYSLEMTFASGWPVARSYDLAIDDSLISLQINGRDVAVPQGLRLWPAYQTFDLRDRLEKGENKLSAKVINSGGPCQIEMAPAWNDPWLLSFAVFSLILLLLHWRLFSKRAQTSDLWLYGIAIAGIFLRFAYFLRVPWLLYGHDTESHVVYLDYVGENFSIPPFNSSFEAFQPPLYYYAAVLWRLFFEALGFGPPYLYTYRALSLPLSVGFLLISCSIAKLLFKGDKSFYQPLFAAVPAFLPSAIFFTGRIGNDSLSHLFFGLTLLFALKWWQSGGNHNWMLCCITCALGLLVKSNMLSFVPFALALPLFRTSKPLPQRLAQSVLGAVLILAIAGWYAAYRYQEGQREAVPNFRGLPRELFVRDDAWSFVAFNPRKVLELKYNDPLGDAHRRRYIWEYIFKSAFFGESRFPGQVDWVSSALLLSGMHLMAVALIGFAIALFHWQAALPLLALFISGSASMLSFRLGHPVANFADFRYSAYLLWPLMYFVFLSSNSFPKFLQHIVSYQIGLLSGLSVLFFLYLF